MNEVTGSKCFQDVALKGRREGEKLETVWNFKLEHP